MSQPPRRFYSNNRTLPRTPLTTATKEPTIENQRLTFEEIPIDQIALKILPSQFSQKEVVISGEQRLKQKGLVIKDKLTGKITASEGDALFTSFAYDEGYRVKINGKKAETFSVNGFLAVKLNAGENQVVVDFMPRGFYLGLALFLLGALLCALYLIFYKKIQKIKFIEKPSVLAVYALGILVGAVIYLFPVAFYLIV